MNILTKKPNSAFLGLICIFVAFISYMQPTVAQAEVDTIKVATFEQDLGTQEPGLSPLGKYLLLGKDLYFKTFTESDSQETRDAGFLVFYEYYTKMLEEINKDTAFLDQASYSATKEQRAKVAAIAAEYGFKIDHLGEGTFGAIPDTNYLSKTFGKFLSNDFKAYFTFIKNSQGYAQDAGLMIGHDELRKLIILGDAIAQKYPDTKLSTQILGELEFMVGSYLAGLDNTPIYGAKRKLEPEVKASFERFLRENKKSTYYPTVKAVYDMLKKNNFTVTQKVLSNIWEIERKMRNDL